MFSIPADRDCIQATGPLAMPHARNLLGLLVTQFACASEQVILSLEFRHRRRPLPLIAAPR